MLPVVHSSSSLLINLSSDKPQALGLPRIDTEFFLLGGGGGGGRERKVQNRQFTWWTGVEGGRLGFGGGGGGEIPGFSPSLSIPAFSLSLALLNMEAGKKEGCFGGIKGRSVNGRTLGFPHSI